MAGEPALSRRGKDAPERSLIEAAQRDPACFAQLYEDNFERVYAFIARRVGDRDQAQDLTADVFHSALKNLSRFEWRGAPFAAWLFRIAANAIADRGKRAAPNSRPSSCARFLKPIHPTRRILAKPNIGHACSSWWKNSRLISAV